MQTSGRDGMVGPLAVVPIADPDPYSAIEGLQPSIDAAGVQVAHDPINIVVVAFRLAGHVSVPFPCARSPAGRIWARSSSGPAGKPFAGQEPTMQVFARPKTRGTMRAGLPPVLDP